MTQRRSRPARGGPARQGHPEGMPFSFLRGAFSVACARRRVAAGRAVGTACQALAAALALAALAGPLARAQAPVPASAQPPAQAGVPDEVEREMRAAFIYGYPYYELQWLRHEALSNPASLTHAALNTFRHQRHLATPSDRWANGPIHDTLYSTAWLDLRAGPAQLDLPDTADRYYVIAMVSADGNTFEYLGRRRTGTQARTVTVVGPRWNGAIPAGDPVVRAPTEDVYLNLRVLVRDAQDLPRAHALQDRFGIRQAPGATPAERPRLPPISGDVGRLLDVLNEGMARNPPPPAEASLLERYRAVGVCGAECRFADLPAAVQARWRNLVPAMIAQFKSALDADRRDIPRVKGWLAFRLPRSFGSNYRMRAGSAANSGGIFGLEAAEAIYFFGVADAHDDALGDSPGRRYRLHLPAGGLPADAFWSITLYEMHPEGHYLTPNAIDRYVISDRTPGLVRGADGSLDIWIQSTPPASAEQRANWLPSPPARRFVLNARVYQPRREALDPRWSMPGVERLPQP